MFAIIKLVVLTVDEGTIITYTVMYVGQLSQSSELRCILHDALFHGICPLICIPIIYVQ